jgi:hypothetical protein
LATISFTNTEQLADGTAKALDVITDPAGLNFEITYNGSANVPTGAGVYAVVVTIVHKNYEGTASGTLTLKTVLGINTKGRPTFQMYPNPAAEYFIVKSEKVIQAVRLYTFNGRLVQISAPNGDREVRIKLKEMAAGIYFVVVETEGGVSNMTQLIIE